MKHLFKKIKRKKSPKPPRQPIPPEKPADIAAGPPADLPGAEPDDTIPDDAGRNVSDNDPEADHTDLTVLPDEGGKGDPRVLFQNETDEELPASGASTSGVATGGADYGDQLATEGFGGGETGPLASSTVANETHGRTLPRGAESNTEKFGPLKVVLANITALFADRTETVAVENRVSILLSRIASLEDRFDSRPTSLTEQRRRDDLILKLKAIEAQLRPLSETQELDLPTDPIQFCEDAWALSENQELDPPTDHVQFGEDVFRLLEDLREAILSYQMAQQMATDGQGLSSIDPAEATVLNNVWCAKQAEYRHGNRNGCLKGTRAAILDEIELWTRDFHKPAIYWLNGLAGTGKSTIAQTIAERTTADGRLGASFFCSRDFEDRRNLQAIFPTLAVQLARRYTQFRSSFIRLVQSDPEIVHESLYGQMKKLIVHPLAESAVSTIIVIDALDECTDKEPASAILSVLGQFVAEFPNVKFFITGRPESRILEGFRLPPLVEATDVFVLHEVEPSQIDNDIRLFFTHSFSELKRHRRVLGECPTKEQVDLLCKRAGGLFVHAVATIRFIDHRSNSPKKQLDRLLQSQGSSAFEGKTEFKDNVTLNSLYTMILQEAFGRDDPENDPRIRSILGAVVLAVNPLSPSAIATLLGFEVEEVYPILLLISSLLILQEDIDQPVRSFHKSFPDFVADPARCTNQRFRLCPPDQHMELLAGCLETMNRDLERNMCHLPDGVTNSEVIDLKERTEEHIGQALEYACKSWHKHLVGTIPAHVAPVLHEFLEKKFLFWLEALSVLGAAREAVDALEAASRCEWPDASSTPNIVEDYVRFVLAFFEVINTSAPHIYHSALPLSPGKSTTYEMHKKYANPLVRVIQGMPVSWEPAVATADIDLNLREIAWSPCNRFIVAVTMNLVEILDAVTLSRLSIFSFRSPYSFLHGRPLLDFSPDNRCLTLFTASKVLTWDLQTGGLLSAIPSGLDQYKIPISSKHSKDGKMVAVAYKYMNNDKYDYFIYTYDLLSEAHVGSRQVLEGRIPYPIWTQDEDLRFATIDPRSIRIWKSPFTLEHPPVEVTSLPFPDGITLPNQFLFLPSLFRLAFIDVPEHTIQVWDLKTLKLLLKSELAPDPPYAWMTQVAGSPCGSFNSDGRFFACTNNAEVCVWKESPAGYLLHQRFPFFIHHPSPGPQLSPNGESTVIPVSRKIHRLHTRDQDLSLPSVSTEGGYRRSFTLGFSADERLAGFGRQEENTVTVIDLQSGEPRWIVNMGVEIDCLRMAGSTVVVVGEEKIVTCNLLGEDCTFNASIHDVVRTTLLDFSSPFHNQGMPWYMSISPDLSRIVTTRVRPNIVGSVLQVYSVSTGLCLASIPVYGQMKPRFSQDGREVWAGYNFFVEEWEECKIIEDSESGAVELNLQGTPGPKHGVFRESSSGHAVTEGGWVLSPSQKRLLWLPHRWRTDFEWDRAWGGRFLGLLHGELSEVVVLELIE